MPSPFADPLLDVDFTRTALYDELERVCGVRPAEGREEVDAVVLSGSQARTLETTPGSAAFSIHRTTCAAETVLEWRTTLVRADRFRISTTFSARSGSRLSVPAADAEPSRRRR